MQKAAFSGFFPLFGGVSYGGRRQGRALISAGKYIKKALYFCSCPLSKAFPA
jgi:hypothetical protein